RSGKIMRRLLRNIAEGDELGDTTTLRDPAVVDEIKQKADRGLTKNREPAPGPRAWPARPSAPPRRRAAPRMPSAARRWTARSPPRRRAAQSGSTRRRS